MQHVEASIPTREVDALEGVMGQTLASPIGHYLWQARLGAVGTPSLIDARAVTRRAFACAVEKRIFLDIRLALLFA